MLLSHFQFLFQSAIQCTSMHSMRGNVSSRREGNSESMTTTLLPEANYEEICGMHELQL